MYLPETVVDEPSRKIERLPGKIQRAYLKVPWVFGPSRLRDFPSGVFLYSLLCPRCFASHDARPGPDVLIRSPDPSSQAWGIPSAIGSAIVIVFVLAILSFLVFELSGPLAELLEKAPETGAKLQLGAQPLRRFFDRIASTDEQVEKLTKTTAETKKEAQAVELKKTNLLDTVFSGTSKTVFSLLLVVVLLYFLLTSGDLFLTKLVHVLPTLSDKKKAVQIAREIEGNISRYLSRIASINAGIGILSGFLFRGFGLPNPALWGAIAGLLNFIPTVGALSLAILITLISLATFPSLTHAALVPVVFLALTVAMGTFVIPLIVRRRLTLNPVVIFLGLSFWGWLWGIPGALLAVPMLAMFKIFCDRIEPLAPIGEFLGN
jgi:predicted PurR-regulated permease PerM